MTIYSKFTRLKIYEIENRKSNKQTLNVPPKTFHANEHDIDHSQIDPDALYVIEKLKKAGHTAYIVGGGVRDLLIKRTPKDFDISTSASPEEIKHIFI